jgi:hypothetical protein
MIFHGSNTSTMRRDITGMSDTQLASIGAVTVLWNGIERNLVGCIWEAAGWKQEIGELVTADLGNVARPDLLMNLVNRIVTDDNRIVDQTRRTLALLDIMRGARNDLMHGFFDWSKSGPASRDILHKFTAKKRSGAAEAKAIPVAQATLDSLFKDMLLCNESLDDLRHKLLFRQRFLEGERDVFAQNYEDAVHGWRAPCFDIQLVRECLKRRTPPPNQPRNQPPPRSSQA